MQLALYKGPAEGRRNKLGHWLVRTLTRSDYSHIELVIDGVCWSSSFRDGGVRGKVIDLTSGRWDVYPVRDDAALVMDPSDDGGKPYDWPGMARVCPLLRWLPATISKLFCSEAVGRWLGHPDPGTLSPQTALEKYRK